MYRSTRPQKEVQETCRQGLVQHGSTRNASQALTVGCKVRGLGARSPGGGLGPLVARRRRRPAARQLGERRGVHEQGLLLRAAALALMLMALEVALRP